MLSITDQYVPIEVATKKPCGDHKAITDRCWVVHYERGVLFRVIPNLDGKVTPVIPVCSYSFSKAKEVSCKIPGCSAMFIPDVYLSSIESFLLAEGKSLLRVFLEKSRLVSRPELSIQCTGIE